jgi:hypothetical protein
MEFDPTAKNRMDRVLDELKKRWDYDYEPDLGCAVVTNYPIGDWSMYEDIDGFVEISQWTHPYFSVTLQRMVPPHVAIKENNDDVVITHFIGKQKIDGRFMEVAEILLP